MINIVEFDDRLVFTNLGTFIPGNIRKVLESEAPQEDYHNKFLVAAMVELKMVDTIGSGIRRMFGYQRKRLFPMPDYDFSDGRVKLMPDVLTPKQKIDKIGNLLAYLRKQNQIQIGKGKRWNMVKH